IGSATGLDGDRSHGRIGLLRSKDGGETFDSRELSLGGRFFVGLAPGAVLSDGMLVIPYMDTDRRSPDGYEGAATEPNVTVKVAMSSDGGEHFGKSSVVSSATMGNSILGEPYHFAFAVDGGDGPFRDRMYAAWSNAGGESANIVLCYSGDKGKTWSKPVVINDDPTPLDPSRGPLHFAPVLAVDRDGVVGIRWADRRDAPNGLDWTVRFTASLDGGDTWLPSVAVSDSPFRHRKGDRFPITAMPTGGGNASPYNSALGGGPIRLDLA